MTTNIRPHYFPETVETELQKQWGDAIVNSLYSRLPQQLPANISIAEFQEAANDLINHKKPNGDPIPYNIAMHPNPTIPPKDGKRKKNAHCHASGFGLDIVEVDGKTKLITFAPNRNYNAYPFPYETLDQYNKSMGMHEGCVIVGQTVYRHNNDYLIFALEQAKGRAMGVASVPTDISNEDIEYLHSKGVRGFRFTGVQRLMPPGETFNINPIIEFDKRLKALNLEKTNINLYLESGDLIANRDAIEKMANPVILDHFAIIDVWDYKKNGDSSVGFQTLDNILADPLNMVKGPGPERTMMSNIPENLSEEKRQYLLSKDFNLSSAIEDALNNPANLTPAVRGELAVNSKIWDDLVLPPTQKIIIAHPKQVMGCTDAQHPNTTVAVDDGLLMKFLEKCTTTGSAEETADLQDRVFYQNACDTYWGNKLAL